MRFQFTCGLVMLLAAAAFRGNDKVAVGPNRRTTPWAGRQGNDGLLAGGQIGQAGRCKLKPGHHRRPGDNQAGHFHVAAVAHRHRQGLCLARRNRQSR